MASGSNGVFIHIERPAKDVKPSDQSVKIHFMYQIFIGSTHSKLRYFIVVTISSHL